MSYRTKLISHVFCLFAISLLAIHKNISVVCEYVIGGNLITLNIHNRSGNLVAWEAQYDSIWFGLSPQLNNNVNALAFDPLRRIIIAGGEFDVLYDNGLGQSPVRLRGLAIKTIAGNEWQSLGDLAINSKGCIFNSDCSAVYTLILHSNESQLAIYVGGRFPGVTGKNDLSASLNSSPNNVAKCIFDGNSWSWSVGLFSSGTDGPVLVIAYQYFLFNPTVFSYRPFSFARRLHTIKIKRDYTLVVFSP